MLPGLRDSIDATIGAFDTLDVFVTPPGGMELVGGFNFHRGCLALGVRPSPPPTLDDVGLHAPGARLVLGLQSIANADNVGAIFRNAAAFGVRAVVLDTRSRDPLYRKATRTSMGTTLSVPFTATEWFDALDVMRRAGYQLVALTPSADALDIDEAADLPELADDELALRRGSEGSGLDDETLARADFRVAIKMAPGVDS